MIFLVLLLTLFSISSAADEVNVEADGSTDFQESEEIYDEVLEIHNDPLYDLSTQTGSASNDMGDTAVRGSSELPSDDGTIVQNTTGSDPCNKKYSGELNEICSPEN